MIKRVIILGGGSAGFLSALTLKKQHRHLEISVLRSKEIGIIGVGEGTTPAVPLHLHGYLELDQAEFYRQTRSTWKLGIRFLWGPRTHFDYTFGRQMDWKWNALSRHNGFYCNEEFSYADMPSAMMSHDRVFLRGREGQPIIRRNFGYHIENERFVGYLEGKARAMGIQIVEETVVEVKENDSGIAGLRMASGGVWVADLYVDCSGFHGLLLGKTLREPYLSFKSTLFCDRALVGGWERCGEPVKPYTTSETMEAGWCWQIEHESRINRGYVYSSEFLSDEEAEREFRAKNPKVQQTRLIAFPSGRYERSWVKNVVAIGNASGFVEPLEATSLAVICSESRQLSEILRESDCNPTETLKNHYNIFAGRAWDNIRQFLGVHYKFNRRVDTPFWRANLESCDIREARAVAEFFEENGPSPTCRFTLLRPTDMFGMEGYLVMFVGMKVPYKRPYEAPNTERVVWDRIRAHHRTQAQMRGVSIPDAFRAIFSPNWQWDGSLYKEGRGVPVRPFEQNYTNVADEPQPVTGRLLASSDPAAAPRPMRFSLQGPPMGPRQPMGRRPQGGPAARAPMMRRQMGRPMNRPPPPPPGGPS